MASIYKVIPGSKRDTLELHQVLSSTTLPGPGFQQIVPVNVGGKTFLLAFNDQGEGSVFFMRATEPVIEGPQDITLKIGTGITNVEPFILGNLPYLLTYDAKGGTFSIYPIGSDVSLQTPYTFVRTRVPATQNYTVTEPVVINNMVYILCYSFTTGEVDAWSVNVTSVPQAGSKPGTPALLMLPTWIHQWAKNWTHFAFFYMGEELFFFKINTGKLNVNIDHILDDPSEGSVEVGTHLENQLDDPKNVDIVEPFTMGGGEPHFVYYFKTGKTQLFRIHADCQGWTKQADAETEKNATLVVPYQVGSDQFILFY